MFLFGDVRGKRLFVLQGILILQMEYLPGGTALDYPIKVGKDMILATTFAMLQVWLPPRSNARQCDESLAKCWNFIDHIVKNALRVCWTDDPIECALCMNELTTEPFQNLINIIPGQMNFIMYEFWESTLRLELRKERFEHIKTCNPFLHALTDSARSMMVRRLQGMKVVRQPETEPPRQKKDNPLLDSEEEYSTNSREPFAWTRSQSSFVGPAAKTRPSIVTNREQVFRSQADTELWRRSRELLSHSVDNYLFCLKDVTTALGKYLNPKDVATKVPFDALRDAAENLYQDLNKMHFEILIKGNKAVSPFVYSHTVFFHVTLISLAEHLFQYGEKMRNFDRSNYKSQWRRMWEFFFYDHWSRFWEDLPKRLTLATPRDVRIVKDAIKMFCAYGIGAVYTQYTDVENAYYFGMAILIGVGQPTAGDTMIASVYRITGMVCACSIAYIAVWHTNNLAGELAISLAGVFIAALFRDVQLYAHTAQYCSMLICTALNSAGTKLTLLSRIVSNTFTVMTYYVICVFIFPIDVLRVTDAAKVKALGVVLDRFSGLVDIATQPVVLESDDDDDDDEDDSGSASFHGDGKSKMTIERHENKVFIRQYTQERLEALRLSRTPMWVAVHAFGMWMMKAAAEPTSHGNAYPLDDMKNVYSSLKRLASATDVLHAGLTTLCRPRVTGTGSQHHHHKAVRGMMRSVLKVTVSIDAHVRIMIQDFIDAMAIPLQWNMERATVHFTDVSSPFALSSFPPSLPFS
ncbi:hypothetical protein AGDE_11946 [Angomonas deanei]|uniref:Fusaric acid resistance protein-like n=1 Tax=Angomonas deanei TaxID=59799 RepID=A0A7G2C6H8_9TRYP|nr:hypothetical protein AGDE_11946 [Angomonas deanei]CAD2215085.1 hypothetical protein, conserved [Angomonas deanei]|eukprot:EPY25248.1 hypothetical protein AGDE_11946 [Angomonas deanei]